jgi:ribonucleoside-diphosphate reductase alpha chain
MGLLADVVHVAVRMIDNAISASWFPIDAINESVINNRRVGLGLTGWADCLSISDVPYDSDRAIEEADILASNLRKFAEEASYNLAIEKGSYPNSALSGEVNKRNIALLALPPSGNNALIFDTSFSIEPHFSLSYSERVMGDQILQHRNRHLEAAISDLDMDVSAVFDKIEENNGSVQSVEEVPLEIRLCFKTAHEIPPLSHVKMQATFQRHVDNAVTKTVNLPNSATVQNVEEIYRAAWKARCKGITIYRDGSRGTQAIEFSSIEEDTKQLEHCEECIVVPDIVSKEPQK